MAVSLLAALPSATAPGVAVGDTVIVDGVRPRTFIKVFSSATGTYSWQELSPGAGQPDAFSPAVVFTPGAGGSQRITISGGVVDAYGTPIDGAEVTFTISGTAANLSAANAVTGVVTDARDLSATASQVTVQTAANGLFSVQLDWGAAEAATEAVVCGPFAIATAAVAFP